MGNEEEYREVQTRERLMHIFLIISGFLLAFSKEDERQSLIPIFVLYILFAIFYYIFLTRTKNHTYIDVFGFLSSYLFTLLLLVFMQIQLKSPAPDYSFIGIFVSLTVVFTFAFLSPESSKKLEGIGETLESKYPQLWKIVTAIIVVLIVIYGILELYGIYHKM